MKAYLSHAAACVAFSLLLTSCFEQPPKTVTLSIQAPRHFLSTNVEQTYPTRKAIPYARYLDAIPGAGVEIQADPSAYVAQLRLIKLPASYHATKEAAKALAASGAIQDCDIVIVFRPEWSRTTGYGNVQLGMGHAGITFIDKVDGERIVQTVESPLNYSSNLDYPGHYAGHDMFHIIRPNLSGSQRKNVVKWMRLVLEKGEDHLKFQSNYGTPYFVRSRPPKSPASLSVDLAKMAAYGTGNVEIYCSELVWALLGLRDCNPDEVLGKFPAYSPETVDPYLAGQVTPFFDPLPAMSDDVLNNPGLMQGPDVVLRRVYLPGEDEQRRQFMLTEVLVDKAKKPSDFDGIMSQGHKDAGEAYKPKIQQLRQFYGAGKEEPTFIAKLNEGVPPNYSPGSFFILANSDRKGSNGKKLFYYVGTVSFRP